MIALLHQKRYKGVKMNANKNDTGVVKKWEKLFYHDLPSLNGIC